MNQLQGHDFGKCTIMTLKKVSCLMQFNFPFLLQQNNHLPYKRKLNMQGQNGMFPLVGKVGGGWGKQSVRVAMKYPGLDIVDGQRSKPAKSSYS